MYLLRTPNGIFIVTDHYPFVSVFKEKTNFSIGSDHTKIRLSKEFLFITRMGIADTVSLGRHFQNIKEKTNKPIQFSIYPNS